MTLKVHNLPEFTEAFKEVCRQAHEDAKLSGTGWIRFERLEDGNMGIQSMPPSRVLYFADDPEIPEKEG